MSASKEYKPAHGGYPGKVPQTDSIPVVRGGVYQRIGGYHGGRRYLCAVTPLSGPNQSAPFTLICLDGTGYWGKVAPSELPASEWKVVA